MYGLEIDRVSDEIKRRKAKRILLQLPDGLRPQAFELVRGLRERTGAEIFLSGGSCYGACDLALREASALDIDMLVHFGHSPMLPANDIPVLYIEARAEIDLSPLIEAVLPLMVGWSKVGLTTSVQHIHQLEEVAKALRVRGIDTLIGRGGRLPYDGQVTGCDYSSAQTIKGDVDGFLFIGGGRFHPLGLALATGKPVVAGDPYLISATALGDDELKRFAMRRMASLSAAKKAFRIGIIVSLKPGQFNPSAAMLLRDKLEKGGRETVIICADDFRSETLVNFSEAEAFVDTACPRMAIDGLGDLIKPLLTLTEAYVLIGEKKWEEIWGASYLG